MKRIWFAVIFMALAAGICTFEQMNIKSTYIDITNLLNAISQSIEDGDYGSAANKCTEISEKWRKEYPILTATNDHGTIDETSEAIDSLSQLVTEESDDLPCAIDEAKHKIKTIYQSAVPTFGNIF